MAIFYFVLIYIFSESDSRDVTIANIFFSKERNVIKAVRLVCWFKKNKNYIYFLEVKKIFS